MSSHKYPPVSDPADREAFIRENAVALVAERDALIVRLRKRIADLEKSNRALRIERDAARQRR